MLNQYKLYIFDWDGTLMDSISRIVSSMQAAAAFVGIDEPNEAETKAIIGLSLPIAVSTLFPSQPESVHQAIVEQYKLQFQTLNTTPMPLFPHAMELLTKLREQGKQIAVATGKGRNGLNRVMALTNTAHLFHATRCSDETVSKPDPEMLYQLLAELKVEPSDAVMIGDTGFDLAMANNANINNIAVTMGVGNAEQLSEYQPKATVNSLSELAAVIT